MRGAAKKTTGFTLAMRVVLPLACLGLVLFIFSRSGLPGEVSGQASQQLAAWLTGAETPVPGTALESTLRKLAHVAEYAALGLLLMLTVRAYTRRVIAYSGWALLAGLCTAVLDEVYQLFIPGRAGQVRDVALDFVSLLGGAAVALAILWLVRTLRRPAAPAA